MDAPGLVRRAPAPPLRGHVGSYYEFREETPGPVRRHEGPGIELVLVVSFGHDWLIGDLDRPLEPYRSFVGGLRDTQVVTEHAGRSHGMQVNLSPPSAYALLGLPLHSLAGSVVALDDLLGRDGDALVERLWEAGSWQARFDVLDRELAARLADGRPPSPGVVWAYERLRASHGGVRIRALAAELGWSEKRLVARFREQVGLTPKALGRVLRFERAVELADRGDRAWAEIAFACGYYDQSHMINEFRAISGRTPVAFLQDAGGAAA